MIRNLVLATLLAATPALALAPLANAQEPNTQTVASQPVPNPPPSTTENGPGTADTGYTGPVSGPQFYDFEARLGAAMTKYAGNRRAMSQLHAIQGEMKVRKARHGGELRDWDREFLDKKLRAVEGMAA